jgi:intein/homing endonuclease
LQVHHRGGRYYYAVALTGSSSEYWYYEHVVQPASINEFDATGSLRPRRDGTTRYHVYGERVARALLALGFPLGKKHDACIPPAVIESDHVIAFIRGSYHAEGRIYRRHSKICNRMKKVYDSLLVVQIKMKLPTLMRQLNEELLELGIATKRLSSKDGVYTLRITDQGMIRNFFEIIKPRLKTSPKQVFNLPQYCGRPVGLWLRAAIARSQVRECIL